MKPLKLFFLFLFIGSVSCCSQDLTCADFKTGSFYIPIANALRKHSTMVFDSINREPFEITIERDPNVEKIVILRRYNSQIEWTNEIGNGTPQHEIIEWIDECTFRLKTDETKMDLDDEDEEINGNNGIIIGKINIQGRCMEYKATMTTPEGHKISQLGLICKE